MSRERRSWERYGFPVIITERLILRRFGPEDAGVYAQELYADPAVTQYLRQMPDLSPQEWAQAQVQRHMDSWERYGIGPWAVTDLEHGALLGHGGFRYFNPDGNPDPHIGELELIYALARRAWGRGLATEIARACVRYGFEQMDAPYLCALTHPANAASQQVLYKVGMERDEHAHLALKAHYFRLARDRYRRSDALYRVVTQRGDR